MVDPTFTVVQGQWQAAPGWLNFRPVTVARSPFNRDAVCSFRIGKEDAVKQAMAHRRQPVMEFWSGVMGVPPPVPNVTRYNASAEAGLISLVEAHACFQGIKRPCSEDGTGESLIAYVLKPRWSYEFEPSMVCVAKKFEVADDLVFVVYAKIDAPWSDSAPTKGCITHWQFVEADAETNYRLPIEFAARYARRLW